MVRGNIRKGAATAPPPPLLKERVKLDVSGSMHAISDSQVSDIETLCVRGEEERWAALNFCRLQDGRLFEVGPNSRFGIYLNKYCTCVQGEGLGTFWKISMEFERKIFFHN